MERRCLSVVTFPNYHSLILRRPAKSDQSCFQVAVLEKFDWSTWTMAELRTIVVRYAVQVEWIAIKECHAKRSD